MRRTAWDWSGWTLDASRLPGMVNPTPMLRPSPLDISGLFAGSLEALKRRLGLFALLALAPSILLLILLFVAALIGGGGFAAGTQNSITFAIILVSLLLLVGSIVVALFQLKSLGMMTLAAYEIAQDQRPDFKGLLSRTKGFLPRLAPVIGIVIGIVIVVNLFLVGISYATLNNLNTRVDVYNAMFALVGIFSLLFLVSIPVLIFLGIKFLYLVPAVTLEERGGIDALKRSWNLTKGSFWRTLGYAILPQLAVLAVLYAVALVAQLLATPALAQMGQADSPAAASAYMFAALPLLLVSAVLQIVIQLFTTPFLQAYTTYMFVDQVRRVEQPAHYPGYGAQPGYGYPGAPAQQQPFPAQGQPQFPGQGQQPYPGQGQQPYPGQGQQPNPGQGQQPNPGQQYPGHGHQFPGQQPNPPSGQG